MQKQLRNVRVQTKRDTSANWTANNPVLLDGEIILVDTAEGELRAKVGDGVKTYTQLPFSDEALRALIENKQDKLTFEAGDNVSIDIDEGTGTVTISADGGANSIHVGAEAPTGDEEVWIDTDDIFTPSTSISHNDLIDKNYPTGQHTISAIDGLQSELDDIRNIATNNVTDHRNLSNRNTANQHSIDAITGLSTSLNTIDTSISDINSSISTLEDKTSIVLLWENAAPTSPFAAQTIPQSSLRYPPGNFDRLLIDFCVSTSSSGGYSNHYISGNFKVGDSKLVMSCADNVGSYLEARSFMIDSNSIYFNIGQYAKTYATATLTDSAAVLVPIRIYGIKGVI